MKTKSPINRLLPKNSYNQLKKILKADPPAFKHETDTFIFILDSFYRINEYNIESHFKKGGYVEVSSRYFSSYIKNGYNNYLKYLLMHNIIQTDGSYDSEKHICLGYKINPKFEDKLIKVAINTKSTIAKKIRENVNKRRKRENKQVPFIKRLKRNLKSIKLDYNKAIKLLDKSLYEGEITINKYNRLICKLISIEDKQIYCNRNKTNNRLDTNFTNAKKILRQFIEGDYIQIDLCNSQPYLLNYLIKRYNVFTDKRNNNTPYSISSCEVILKINPIDHLIDKHFKGFKNDLILDKSEIERFNQITRDNLFYNLFMDEYGITRDEAKKLTLSTLYSPNGYSKYEKEKLVFKKQFPTIYKLIFEYKRKDYPKLAIILQKLEAELFLDCIAKDLTELGVELITIHDSLIIQEKDNEKAKFAIEYHFMKYFGEIPTFKIEGLNSDAINIEIYNVIIEKYNAVA